MANELQYTNSATYTKNGQVVVLPGVTSALISVNGNVLNMDVMSVGIADTTIPLGAVAAPFGVCVFKNLDAVNAISIRVAAGGAKIIRLLPGECWQMRLDSGVTVPVAIADAGTPLLAFAILPP
jgi:hypothetical protein